MNDCKICGNKTDNITHVAQEKHLGLGDCFNYFECSACDCLQIAEVPENLSKYYPSSYYSYNNVVTRIEFARRGLGGQKQRFILDALTNYYFGKKDFFRQWLSKRSSVARDYPLWVRKLQLNLGLRKTSSILDVGSGKGQLLQDMRAYGFTNLQGVDPFIDVNIFYDNGVKVYKKSVNELNDKFDLVMLNHSFEHMPDQLLTLMKLRSLLTADSYLVIRVPIVGSYQWQRYGLNWVGLDAPRHLFLHSLRSMGLLATQAGLSIEEIVFDSEPFTIWGSEQYEAGISLVDERSHVVNPAASIFSSADIERFTAQTDELNKTGKADCAVFCLKLA